MEEDKNLQIIMYENLKKEETNGDEWIINNGIDGSKYTDPLLYI